MTLAVAAVLGTGPAAAAPPTKVLTFTTGPTSVAGLQAAAAQVRGQLAGLDEQAQVLTEQYDQARSQLDQITARLATARMDLTQAQNDLAAKRTVMGQRIASMYKNSSFGMLDVLLSSGDFSQLETNIDFYRKLAQQDQVGERQVERLVASVDALTQQIGAERDQAQAIAADLSVKAAVVENKIAERQAILDKLDTKVKALIEQQQAAARRAADALARATGAKIGNIPGTAVQLAVVRETMKYLGVPYVWGGASPSQGFDCSGLVLYVYAKFGVNFPHGATMQAHMGTPVPFSQLEPADLVFFGDPSFYHHVGIYIGKGLFIEAPHTGDVVKISKLAGRGASLACRYSIHF
jgi:cell wall-associated NlpC family hydrolase